MDSAKQGAKMRCIECKNFDMLGLQKEPVELRKTGWAQCKEGKFYNEEYNGERVNGLMERTSCHVAQFERMEDAAIDARIKYLGVSNG